MFCLTLFLAISLAIAFDIENWPLTSFGVFRRSMPIESINVYRLAYKKQNGEFYFINRVGSFDPSIFHWRYRAARSFSASDDVLNWLHEISQHLNCDLLSKSIDNHLYVVKRSVNDKTKPTIFPEEVDFKISFSHCRPQKNHKIETN